MTDRSPARQRMARRKTVSLQTLSTIGLALALTTAGTAQRASCTGTLRDAAGAPIAGAVVTFSQEISQTFGVYPDRVVVPTGADGSFAGALLTGSPYVVTSDGRFSGPMALRVDTDRVTIAEVR